MKPIVNTDVKMPKKMFDALCLFETTCVANLKTETNEKEVKKFLEGLYSKDFADKFKSEYLY
jgi:hypothetical protein